MPGVRGKLENEPFINNQDRRVKAQENVEDQEDMEAVEVDKAYKDAIIY